MKHPSRITVTIGVIVLITFLGAIATFGSLIYAAATADWSHGIKPMLEAVWCGKAGCAS